MIRMNAGTKLFVLALAVGLAGVQGAAASVARGQDGAKPPVGGAGGAGGAAPSRADGAPDPVPPADDPHLAKVDPAALPVKATGELPATIRLVPGDRPTASKEALAFFDEPTKGDLPKPASVQFQTFQADGGKPGSQIVWTYADDAEASKAEEHLASKLWGILRVQSDARPDVLVRAGRAVIVLGFPRGDAACEWLKERLRKSFCLRAPRWSPEIQAMRSAFETAYRRGGSAEINAALAKYGELAANDSLANHQAAEVFESEESFKLATKYFARAAELHEKREDPLTQRDYWRAWDGLGTAQLFARELDAADPSLRRAWAIGKAGGYQDWSAAPYNLACVLALRGKHEEAVDTLAAAIRKNAQWREISLTDDDFKETRQLPVFKRIHPGK